MRWAGNLARIGERRGAYRVLVGESGGKETTWKTRRRWEDNIKMVFWKNVKGVWDGLLWLRIGTDGGLLCRR